MYKTTLKNPSFTLAVIATVVYRYMIISLKPSYIGPLDYPDFVLICRYTGCQLFQLFIKPLDNRL